MSVSEIGAISHSVYEINLVLRTVVCLYFYFQPLCKEPLLIPRLFHYCDVKNCFPLRLWGTGLGGNTGGGKG